MQKGKQQQRKKEQYIFINGHPLHREEEYISTIHLNSQTKHMQHMKLVLENKLNSYKCDHNVTTRVKCPRLGTASS